jgi:hypothetical protein
MAMKRGHTRRLWLNYRGHGKKRQRRLGKRRCRLLNLRANCLGKLQ